MTSSQETRSGIVVVGMVVGAILVSVLVGTGALVVCRSGKAVVGEVNEICCDEVELDKANDAVEAMITLVELAVIAELGKTKSNALIIFCL